MRAPALAAAVALAAAATVAALPTPMLLAFKNTTHTPSNTTTIPPKLDPVVGLGAEAKFLTKSTSSSWDTAPFPPAMITCWVDPRTGIVLGLDDGRGLRCGLGEGVAVQVPLPSNKYVQSVEVGIVPKTDMIGHLKFQISAYNATKYAPTQTIQCGTAAKTLWGEAGQGAAVDALIFNAQRYVAALNKTATGSKNWTAATTSATRVSDCLTDRFAAPLVNASALAAKNPLLAKVAGGVVSKLKDPLKINSTIDAKALDPVYTPRTCKEKVQCVPLEPVTIEDSGCQIAQEGNRFVFVMDRLPYETLYCPYAGVVTKTEYQELTPTDSVSCVIDGTCTLPPESPPQGVDILGAECSVNGVLSPCYGIDVGCPPGQVQITDQAGTCTTGVCCASPPCSTPNELCGGQCVSTQTNALFCGNCYTVCPTGAICVGGQCQCPDGQPVQPGPANGIPVKQGVDTFGDQNVLTYDLGTPSTNGGTCTVGAGTCQCTLFYDSYSVPDRFVVRQGGACATVLYDTGFTGLVNNGCTASGPCCDPAKKPPQGGPGCTGTAGAVCPPGPLFDGTFGGGGTGQGTVNIPIAIADINQPLVVSVYGVCTSTGNAFKLKCCPGPANCF